MALTQDVLDGLLRGQSSFENLPPRNKKIVRIFISSTFSDTKEERNAFMRDVYPKLAQLCRDKYGLEFQVVDMRWGVPEHASENHTTTDLCLQEIRRCQEVSVGPSFLVILGNKYGFRPIPSSLTVQEFDVMKDTATRVVDKRWETVAEWYLLDENSDPPVFVLQPISTKLLHYNDKENPELRKQAQATWQAVNGSLSACLRDTARKTLDEGRFTKEAAHRFFMSVTENEINQGMLQSTVSQSESSVCIIREIPDIHEHVTETKAAKFIDLDTDMPRLDQEARDYLLELRDQKVPTKISEANVTRVSIDWKASGASVTLEDMVSDEDIIGPDDVLAKHKEYLEALSHQLLQKITSMIGRCVKQHEQQLHDDDTFTEVLQHWHFAQSRCEVFEGRADIIGSVMEYLGDASRQPFVIHGSSGCGKTSVVAQIVKLLQDKSSRGQEVTERQGDGAKPMYHMNKNCIAPLVEEGETKQASNASDGVAGSLEPCVGDADRQNTSHLITDNRIDDSDKRASLPLVFFRFLGTTPHTSNIQQLLVSLCKQICRITAVSWSEPENIVDLAKSFHDLLGQTSTTHNVIIFLDSIDQLLPAYNAFRLKWLSKELPKNVKMVISVLEEGYTLLETLRERYEHALFRQVPPLEKELGFLIINKWLGKCGRRVTDQQLTIIAKTLDTCSLPLYARITFDQVRRWRSFDKPTLAQIQTTVKGAINKFFQDMETKFGAPLVKHCLSYLTASRYGLSEVEMEHVLSLDDILLNQIYRFWKPPVRRVPPLLWTRVRHEISSYVVERSADDMLVLYWYHRQFIEACRERYLQHDQPFAVHVHTTLAEFFQGVWGGGKPKPFEYTEAQCKRFGLTGRQNAADRMVPKQPYVTESSNGLQHQTRINKRKLSELPFHLLHAGQIKALMKETFFNFEWLYAKLQGSSFQGLLQELVLFMIEDKRVRNDMQIKILYATMQLIRPYVQKYPASLSYELSGRLAKYIERGENIRALVKQCDTLGVKYCPLVPMYTCFESAQIGMQQNISIRNNHENHWHKGGTFVCSPDFKTMYVIDYDQSGKALLATWDIESGELTQKVPIGEPHEQAIHMYFQCFIQASCKFIVATYRKRFYGIAANTDQGFVDVISTETGAVIRTVEGQLYNRGFFNPVFYLTRNWIALRFGAKLPLHHLFTDQHHRHSQPHMLTHGEDKFLMTKSKSASVRYYVGDEQKRAATRCNTAVIKDFGSGEELGLFDKSDRIHGVAVTKDDRTVILGELDGRLKVYDISRVSPGKVIKVHRSMSLPEGERISVADTCQQSHQADEPGVDHHPSDSVQEAEEGEENADDDGGKDRKSKDKASRSDTDKIALRMSLILSPNDKFLVSCHQGPGQWEAFLWYLGTHSAGMDRGHCVGRVTAPVPLETKYPAFSSDSDHVVVALGARVLLLSTEDASVVKEYDLVETIKDFCVSQSTAQVAVLLQRQVVFVDVIGGQGNQEQSGNDKSRGKRNRRKLKHLSSISNQADVPGFLQREGLNDVGFQPEVVLESDGNSLLARELQDPDEDIALRLTTSTKGVRKVPLEARLTPDGRKLVQMFSGLQVVDHVAEAVKYTPVRADILFRGTPGDDTGLKGRKPPEGEQSQATPTGLPVHEIIRTAGLPTTQQLLHEGDKLVGQNGRVRLRVTKPQSGRLKLVMVPSSLVISNADQDSNKCVVSITTYLESILSLSNRFLVTLKKKGASDFVNVYDVDSGKLLTTHDVGGGSVSLARVTLDECRLVTVGPNLNIRTYTGQNFITTDPAVEIMDSKSKARKFTVKDILCFRNAAQCVLVRFTREGAEGYNESFYVHVDVALRHQSLVMTTRLPFEDVSYDGTLAVDTQLALYDLPNGKVLRQLPYRNAGRESLLRARISPDNNHVVFVDKQDDTLHVIRLTGQSAKIIVSCCAHAPDIPPYGGLSLRHFGRVLAIRGGSTLILLALRPEGLVSKAESKVDYDCEKRRAYSLVPQAGFAETQSRGQAVHHSMTQKSLARTVNRLTAVHNVLSARS